MKVQKVFCYCYLILFKGDPSKGEHTFTHTY